MKRMLAGLLTFVCVLFFAGCMSDEDPDDNGSEPAPPDPEEEPEEQEEEPAEAEDVLAEAIQVQEDLESYVIDTNMNQTIQYDDEEKLTNTYRSTAAVNLEPMRYHENSVIDNDPNDENPDEDNVVSLERYYTEEGFYIFESDEEEWVQIPDEFVEDIQATENRFDNPARTLNTIETYGEDFEIEERENKNHITFSGEEEPQQQIALQMVSMVNRDFSTTMEDILFMSEIESIDYELIIDQETNEVDSIRMDLTLLMNNDEGETYQSTHTIVAHYSSYNEAEEVEIPDYIIEQANDLDLQEFSGFEDMEEFETIGGIKLEEFYEDGEESEEEGTEEVDLNDLFDDDENIEDDFDTEK
ncbi:DUF6612 family protein [Alteribacillus sp. HJP-4]|uniref:DUF6612 family protein n=1 Tax=Alteribacillus sp. HJP-4 TaxID=2775394 RepID=UPI0035CD0214